MSSLIFTSHTSCSPCDSGYKNAKFIYECGRHRGVDKAGWEGCRSLWASFIMSHGPFRVSLWLMLLSSHTARLSGGIITLQQRSAKNDNTFELFAHYTTIDDTSCSGNQNTYTCRWHQTQFYLQCNYCYYELWWTFWTIPDRCTHPKKKFAQ